MTARTFSIRRRLLVLLLGSVVLVWLGMLTSGYYEAREEVNELADAHLEQQARTLLLLDPARLDALAGAPAYAEDSDHDGEHHQQRGFQVWTAGGVLLLRGAGTPPAVFDAHDGFASQGSGHQAWRSYAAYDPGRAYQVRVFEAQHERDGMVRKLARRMALLLLLALPVLALLIWVGIGRGLLPLARIAGAIGARDAGRLQPLAPGLVPLEAQPLVDALNSLLTRLAQSLDRERAFTADAAHELRTPLAAIKVQAEVALAAHDEVTRRHAIGQVIAGVNRSTQLARQLLLLARLDHAGATPAPVAALDQLALDCVALRAGDAVQRGMEFEVEAQPHCLLRGEPATLSVLIDNLLDNAIKYGRERGRIAVGVARCGGELLLTVRDDGAGMAPERRARLLGRFVRGETGDVAGSGLGLSIVDKIAQSCGGSVSIGDGLDGRGLGVTVRLPALAEDSAGNPTATSGRP